MSSKASEICESRPCEYAGRVFSAAIWCSTIFHLLAKFLLTLGAHIVLYSNSYLINPYIFLPCLAFSTSTLETTLHLLVLLFASRGTYGIFDACRFNLTLSRPVIANPLNTRYTSTSISTRNTPTSTNTPTPSLRSSITFGITKVIPAKAP